MRKITAVLSELARIEQLMEHFRNRNNPIDNELIQSAHEREQQANEKMTDIFKKNDLKGIGPLHKFTAPIREHLLASIS